MSVQSRVNRGNSEPPKETPPKRSHDLRCQLGNMSAAVVVFVLGWLVIFSLLA
jgi:hypothetical protein